MQRIPPETWCKIFSTICGMRIYNESLCNSLYPKQPQWVILQVCLHWRRVAESSPELWNRIRIGPSLFLYAKTLDVVTSRLSRMLHNSGQALLSIHLDLRIPRRLARLKLPATFFKKKKLPELGSTEFLTLVSLLAPEYQRWQKISFASYGHSFIEGVISFLHTTGDSIPEFPHLIHLHCYRSENQKADGPSLSFGNITPRFPKLQSLWLKDHLEVDQITSIFPCSQLQDIRLESNREILHLLPQFSHAKRTALIQQQTVATQKDKKVFQPEDLSLSRLKELSLTYWPKNPAQWPIQPSAPHLTVLNIHTLKDADDIRATTNFLEKSGCRLQELQVHYIMKLGDPSILRGLLSAIPDCRVLNLGFGCDPADPEIQEQYYDPDVYDVLSTLWAESAKTFVKLMKLGQQQGPVLMPVYCPRLEQLQIQLHVYDSTDLLPHEVSAMFNFAALGSMVKARYQCGRSAVSTASDGVAEGNMSQVSEGALREVKLTCNMELSEDALEGLERMEDLPGLVVDLKARSGKVVDWMPLHA